MAGAGASPKARSRRLSALPYGIEYEDHIRAQIESKVSRRFQMPGTSGRSLLLLGALKTGVELVIKSAQS